MRTRARGVVAPGAAGELELRLAYRPPLDWRAILGFLRDRAIPGVETVDGNVIRMREEQPVAALDRKEGTVGRPVPGVSAKIVNPDTMDERRGGRGRLRQCGQARAPRGGAPHRAERNGPARCDIS